MKRFAIFILSHGRADTITTYRTFREAGYTGDMFVVIDNEDDDEPKYREQFGDDIIMFNKKEYADRADLGDLDTDRRIGVLARNFIQDEAKRLGYKFHLQLDDDIHGLSIRYEKGDKLKTKKVKDIDKVLDGMCEYMENTKITSLSFGLFAYYMGGVQSGAWKNR